MEESSPARLYCLLVGGALVIAGIIGFFYEASFATGTADVHANSDKVFGILAVNGWHNVVHIVLGRRSAADDPICQGIGGAAVPVVEDLEGQRVLASHQRHEVLVGQALQLSAGHVVCPR